MGRPDTITMSMRELDRCKVIQAVVDDGLMVGHALAVAAQLQAQRDDRRWAGPSRTLVGEPPRPAKVPLSVKRQRLINQLDLEHALQQVGPCPPSSVPVTRTTARRGPPQKRIQTRTKCTLVPTFECRQPNDN